jgi:hypothetical protein
MASDLQIKTAEKLAMTAIFDGKVSLTLPAAALANAPSVSKMARMADQNSIVLDCELAGNLADLTRNQAENLLMLEKKVDKPVTENP